MDDHIEQVKTAAHLSTVVTTLMRNYYEEMEHLLVDVASGKWKEADVVILILNVITNVSTGVYFSLKDFIGPHLNFDYLRAKLINELVDSFEKIKTYQSTMRSEMNAETNETSETNETNETKKTLN